MLDQMTTFDQPASDEVVVIYRWQMEYCKELGQNARAGAALIGYLDFLTYSLELADPNKERFYYRQGYPVIDLKPNMAVEGMMVSGMTSFRQARQWLINQGVLEEVRLAHTRGPHITYIFKYREIQAWIDNIYTNKTKTA